MQFLVHVSILQSGDTGLDPLLQFPHEFLRDYLMVDHVGHSKYDASSIPKEKKTSGRENEEVTNIFFNFAF